MNRLHQVVNWIGYIGVLATVFILALNVASRKFGWPVPGTFSIVSVMAVFLAFPAIIHAYFERSHIIIDTLKSKFSPVTVEIFETIADIFAIGIWGLAGWVGLKYAEKMRVVNEVMDPLKFQVAPFRFIWAIGLLLICLVILFDRISILRRKDRR
jgi:TRAP-type C4-dicarboxylate transport system permease small subunit